MGRRSSRERQKSQVLAQGNRKSREYFNWGENQEWYIW